MSALWRDPDAPTPSVMAVEAEAEGKDRHATRLAFLVVCGCVVIVPVLIAAFVLHLL